ncbi:MAG: hypothetical protein JWO36_4428 [Myxococcales bacterium]|nr:hypothetical protein [Myxococcales bacterium]
MLANSAERRRAARVSPRGTAVLHGKQLTVTARILNVGDGGICVQADYFPVLEPWTNATVTVDVQIEGRRWVTVAGRVVRTDSNTGELVVTFDRTPDEFRELVTLEVLADVERDLAPFIMLVDAAADRRTSIAEAFRGAGNVVVEAATPLEGLMRLCESEYAPEIIAIADTISEELAAELRELIVRAQDHDARTPRLMN